MRLIDTHDASGGGDSDQDVDAAGSGGADGDVDAAHAVRSGSELSGRLAQPSVSMPSRSLARVRARILEICICETPNRSPIWDWVSSCP